MGKMWIGKLNLPHKVDITNKGSCGVFCLFFEVRLQVKDKLLKQMRISHNLFHRVHYALFVLNS